MCLAACHLPSEQIDTSADGEKLSLGWKDKLHYIMFWSVLSSDSGFVGADAHIGPLGLGYFSVG